MAGISLISNKGLYSETRTSGGSTPERSKEDQKRIDELKKIDTQVRAHEAAHQAVAGGLARGKSFTYTTGPDGKQYAIGGEVQIDTSPVPNKPQATIAKMQQVQRAALAPGDPSGQDMAVASQAAAAAAQAQTEKAQTTANPSDSRQNIFSQTYSRSQTSTVGTLYSAMEICRTCQTTTSCGHLSAG